MKTNFSIPQSSPLKDLVRSFWQVERDNVSVLKEIILPKGVVEVIFNFETTPLHAQINKQSLTIPKCFVQGFHTCPVQLFLPVKQKFFGVVLYPTVAKRIFRYNLAEFTNCVIDLTLIDTSMHALWHHLAEQQSFNDRVNVFTDWLIKNLPILTNREQAFNNFLTTPSNIDLTVPDLARHFCYSPKQLTRKLYELTGMNTEQTLLYKRYLKAVHLIHNSQLSMTEITYDCHFSDQSHFSKTFKSLTSLSPREYRNKKSNIMGHLLENVL